MKDGMPVGVSALIFNDTGKDLQIALTLRNKNCRSMHGVWLFPGGAVEPNEMPNNAIIREVYEEVGLHILDPMSYHVNILDVDDGLWLNISYVCYLDESKNKYIDLKNMEPHKFDSVEWVPVGNLPNNTSIIVREFIDEYARGHYKFGNIKTICQYSII